MTLEELIKDSTPSGTYPYWNGTIPGTISNSSCTHRLYKGKRVFVEVWGRDKKAIYFAFDGRWRYKVFFGSDNLTLLASVKQWEKFLEQMEEGKR